MKHNIFIYGLLLILLGMIGGYFLWSHLVQEQSPILQEHDAHLPLENQTLSETYTNYVFRFSLMMPADFTSTEIPGDGGATTILLQNTTGDGIQIMVTPLGEDMQTLTPERITLEIPDLILRDVEQVSVGDAYTGVAFKSNNEAFDKDSREVWFPYKGNLYQISTYARLDPLLKSMFATWKFF